MTPTQKIQRLIRSFPLLRYKLGEDYIVSLDRKEFSSTDFAARFDGASTYEVEAAIFVLSVWGAEDETPLGRFSIIRAMAGWDGETRAAFLAWCQKPFWP